MRIIVISDTHVPERADKLPEKLLEDIKKADMLIHVGDFVSIEMLSELRSLCGNLKAVWGNMDPDEIKNKLPEKEIFNIGKHRIGIIHGFGAPDKMTENLSSIFEKDKPDLIIFGHSHSALNEKKGGVIFFNPGSPTDKVFAKYNSYGIIEINDKIETKIVKL